MPLIVTPYEASDYNPCSNSGRVIKLFKISVCAAINLQLKAVPYHHISEKL